MKQILDYYTFDFNPDIMDIPMEKKIVESRNTNGGNAYFEWPAVLEGTTVTLRWDWMHYDQYRRLRSLYLDSGQEYEWHTGDSGDVYNVVIEDLKAEYLDVILHGADNPGEFTTPRTNVVMKLNIRSASSLSSESSSSSSASQSA